MGCKNCPDGKPKVQTKNFGRPRFLADGTILYRKKGWEPPPVPEGYQRDPKDPWHFLPLWPQCNSRIKTQFMKKCGAIRLLVVCNHPDAATRQQEVTVDICKGCPLRA